MPDKSEAIIFAIIFVWGPFEGIIFAIMFVPDKSEAVIFAIIFVWGPCGC